MRSFLIVKGNPINSLQDWECLSPPKNKAHWKDGRSAKELAKAWFTTKTPQVPEELRELFKSNKDTACLEIDCAVPEKVIKVDELRGGHSNRDLVLYGHAGRKSVIVTIEAKADEPFGEPIGKRSRSAKAKSENSQVPKRINSLTRAVWGETIEKQKKLGELRYQLLHAFCATLVEAREQEASLAIFVVHEFLRTGKVKSKNVDRNRKDFKQFVHALPELKNSDVEDQVLLGPVKIKGGEFVPSNIPIFIGKITNHLRE